MRGHYPSDKTWDFKRRNCFKIFIKKFKSKIRAFDYLGPAFIKYNNINLKILNYSEIEQGSSIELSDGLLYPLNVIPEGKSKMLFEDYLRGLK